MQSASDVILRDLAQVPFKSIRSVADAASVSPLTVIRLVRRWGYGGYTDFQQGVRDWLFRSGVMRDDPADSQIFSDELVASIASAAAMLNGARAVHITGFRSARAFALYMNYMGRMVFDTFHLMAPSGSGAPEDLAPLSDKDVVVAFGTTPYSTETVRLLQAAQQLGIPTIAITDSRQSPLARRADLTVAVPITRPGRLYRMAPMMMVIEDILEASFNDPQADADRRMAYFESRIAAIKGYWKS